MSNSPSAKAEQAERKSVLDNERKLRTTFHQFAESEAGSVGGRFAQHERFGVTGTAPTVDYPRLAESNSTNQQAAVPPEPTIDARDCGNSFGVALGEPHEIEAVGDPLDELLPSSSGGAGDDPIPALGSSPSTFKKRKIWGLAMPNLGFMPTTHKSLDHMPKLNDDELRELGKRYQRLGSMVAREVHQRRSAQQEKAA
jgi:hypothetical protein